MIRMDEQIITEAKERLLSKEFKGVKTGFFTFDRKIGGLANGDLIVVGARVAMGKTTFALSLIENICIRDGKTCLIYTAEKTAGEIVQRIITQHAGIGYKVINDKDSRTPIEKSAKDVTGAHLWIDDMHVANAEELIESWREQGKKERVDLVIVDYLQLLESDNIDLKSILTRLKELAVELDCPVLVLSQLTRAVEKRKHHFPKVSDLPDAKTIDEVADEILFILRPNYYDLKADETYALITVGKHSECSGEIIQINYDPEIPIFRTDSNQ